MGNKKKSSKQLLLNGDAPDDGLVTAVLPEVASDQWATHPDGDLADVPDVRQRQKDKRKRTATTLTISSGDRSKGTVAVAAAGASTKKRRREEGAAEDHVATDGSASDKHDVKNAKVLKKRKHDKSAEDRSVEADGADVEPEGDRGSGAASAKPKSTKSRNGTASVQHNSSAVAEQPVACAVSKKNGRAKAASQQDSPAANSKKSSKNRKTMHAKNHKSGSISDTRSPKNTREPTEQQVVTAATTAKSSREAPAVGESSTAAEQTPSKKAKKHKKKKQTKKESSQTEGHAAAEADTPKVSARDAALAYLDTWKSDKSKWSFQKVRQVWLLQHMYSVADVDDDRFAILLEYLEPLKGKARAETVLKAEEMLAKADDDNGAADAEGGSASPAVNELALLRAKEIVQQLSTD